MRVYPLSGGGRRQIKVRTSFEVRTSIEVCRTSIEVHLQPHFGLTGHSLVVSPFIRKTHYFIGPIGRVCPIIIRLLNLQEF